MDHIERIRCALRQAERDGVFPGVLKDFDRLVMPSFQNQWVENDDGSETYRGRLTAGGVFYESTQIMSAAEIHYMDSKLIEQKKQWVAAMNNKRIAMTLCDELGAIGPAGGKWLS